MTSFVTACPACDTPMVTITMKLVDDDLLMRSCSRCDTRYWQVNGEEIDLTDMLGREPMRQPALR